MKTLIITTVIILCLFVVVYFQYNTNLNLSATVAEQKLLNENKDDAIIQMEQNIQKLKQSEFEYQQKINVLNIETNNSKKLIAEQRNKQQQIYISPVQYETMINANFKKLMKSIECSTGVVCD